MNVLDGYLESIEAPCFWYLDLSTESFYKILINNSITSSKESQDMFDEMAFLILFQFKKKKRMKWVLTYLL